MKLVSQIVLVSAMIAVFAGGVFLLVRSPRSGRNIEIVLPTAAPASETRLSVYVSGAVRNPGVYAVDEGDRLLQVIEAAGGATAGADLAAVNLAIRVGDEDHWHIPKLGESVQVPAAQGSGSVGTLDINSADADLLESLPGIGPVRAASIIRYREANGPFPSVEGLLDVQGIGPATLNAIRDLVEVR